MIVALAPLLVLRQDEQSKEVPVLVLISLECLHHRLWRSSPWIEFVQSLISYSLRSAHWSSVAPGIRLGTSIPNLSSHRAAMVCRNSHHLSGPQTSQLRCGTTTSKFISPIAHFVGSVSCSAAAFVRPLLGFQHIWHWRDLECRAAQLSLNSCELSGCVHLTVSILVMVIAKT